MLVSTFADKRVSRSQRSGSHRAVILLFSSRYCFFQVAPHLYSRGRVDPVPGPRRESNLDLWICSQELSTTRAQRRSSYLSRTGCLPFGNIPGDDHDLTSHFHSTANVMPQCQTNLKGNLTLGCPARTHVTLNGHEDESDVKHASAAGSVLADRRGSRSEDLRDCTTRERSSDE
jgi:hypothetical protein